MVLSQGNKQSKKKKSQRTSGFHRLRELVSQQRKLISGKISKGNLTSQSCVLVGAIAALRIGHWAVSQRELKSGQRQKHIYYAAVLNFFFFILDISSSPQSVKLLAPWLTLKQD